MAASARSYIVTAIAMIIGGMIFLSPKEKATTGAAVEAVAASWQSLIPDQQAKFVAANDSAREAYKAGANEMAKGAARPKRAKEIYNAAQGRTIHDWVGKIATLSSNGDGKGVLSIMIGTEVYLKTWNNSVLGSRPAARDGMTDGLT